jgi:hypothetical protein
MPTLLKVECQLARAARHGASLTRQVPGQVSRRSGSIDASTPCSRINLRKAGSLRTVWGLTGR